MHRRVFLLPLALVTFACAGTRAYSDFDPNARFDTYRAFAWLSEESMLPQADAGRRLDPLLERRIRGSIDAHLETKGYRRLDDREAADFVVSFSVGTRERIRIDSTPTAGGGWHSRYGGWYAGSTVSARSYTEGTLAIDVFDGASHQAVWHGWTSKRVSQSMDRAQLVDDVVGSVLAKFPPER